MTRYKTSFRSSVPSVAETIHLSKGLEKRVAHLRGGRSLPSSAVLPREMPMTFPNIARYFCSLPMCVHGFEPCERINNNGQMKSRRGTQKTRYLLLSRCGQRSAAAPQPTTFCRGWARPTRAPQNSTGQDSHFSLCKEACKPPKRFYTCCPARKSFGRSRIGCGRTPTRDVRLWRGFCARP
jgi:hypothetical protein